MSEIVSDSELKLYVYNKKTPVLTRTGVAFYLIHIFVLLFFLLGFLLFLCEKTISLFYFIFMVFTANRNVHIFIDFRQLYVASRSSSARSRPKLIDRA